MPHIDIKAGSSNVTGQLLGNGTRILVDGREMTDVKSIDLHFGLDEVARCDLALGITDRFEFQGNVDMYLHIHLDEGDQLEHYEDGKCIVTKKR